LGGGHVMRCVTLAAVLHHQEWVIKLASTPETMRVVEGLLPEWLGHLHIHGEDEADPQALKNTRSDGCQVLIVDHYGLDAGYEKELKGWAEKIVVIDDLANRPHDCDVLIDQTPFRTPHIYKSLVPSRCTALCGADYALLRPQFAQLRFSTVRVPEDHFPPRRIAVFMGMGDQNCLSAKALEGIAESGLNAEVKVFLGAHSPARAPVEDFARNHSNVDVRINDQNISNHLAWADLAIGTAGTAAWERCCLALPTITMTITDPHNDNQRETAKVLGEKGAALILGEGIKVQVSDIASSIRKFISNRDEYEAMSAAAAGICDGLGASRTAMYLAPYLCRDGAALTLRRLVLEDSDAVYRWQTTPDVRKYFRDPNPPSPERHSGWMAERVASMSAVTEIILRNGQAAGMIRLDPLAEGGFEVSILVSPDFQGGGVGTGALMLARQLIPFADFKAYVDPRNAASLTAFSRAGYFRQGEWLINKGAS